jgi:glutaredoxin-like protein
MAEMLNESLKAQVTEALSPIQKPVEIVVFTSSLHLGDQEIGYQDETLALLKEVAALNPLLKVEQRSLLTDPEAQALGIRYAPTVLLREEGSGRGNVRFVGLPGGYEFGTLIEALRMLGTGESGLGERSQKEVAKITTPLHLQTFVTPTCPYCPRAVLTIYKLAFHNPQIVAEGIEANEFPQLSERYQISGVPDTLVTGTTTRRILGGQPERVFVEAALQAAGIQA